MKTSLLVAMILTASAGLSFAQDQSTPPRPMGACRADAQKFCPDKSGPDRRSCMMANHDKLSDACKAAIQSRMGGKPGQ